MSEDDNWCPDEDEWTPPTEAELKVIAARRERSDKISKLMGDYLLKGYKMLASNCPQCTTVELQDKHGVKYCVACQEVDCHENSKDNPALSEEAASKGIAEEAFSSNQPPNINSTVSSNSQPMNTNKPININTNQPANISSNPSTNILSHQSPSSNNNQLASISSSQSPVSSSQRFQVDTDRGTRIVIRGEENVGTSHLDLIPRPQPESGAVARPTRRQVQPVSIDDQNSYQSVMSTALSQVLDKLNWASSQLVTTEQTDRATQLAILVRECAHTAHTLKTHSSES